jgi:hypothetical protein
MSYVCRYLQFGSNLDKVPGYPDDLILSNEPTAPIPLILVDPVTKELWYLIFTFESGLFYTANSSVPGQDGALIKSWYAKGGNGHHYLAFTPFVVGGSVDGFIQNSSFVDFSETPTTPTSIDTDAIKNPTVTATVHADLPEYRQFKVSTKSTSHSIIITTTTTNVVFDSIFVYAGASVPVDNALTVAKGQSCYALAVFKSVTSTSSSEVGTTQYPKIPKWEWPMIISEIIKEVAVKGNGEIFEYLSPKVIAESGPEVLKKAVSDIGIRISDLERIKSIIEKLSEGKRK